MRYQHILTIALLFNAITLQVLVCAAQPVFNVKDYGAVGNGSHLDSTNINNAIAAAGAAGGGIVTFPAGNYFCGSIHLTNNITLYLSNNAVILASPVNMDPPEINVYSNYQDFGHSFFHDSLIWGESLTNIAFAGSGEINGNGALSTAQIFHGMGDKALALAGCTNVTITGVTFTNGGHFAILADACYNMLVSGIQILETNQRDGFNLVDSSDVTVTNCLIESSDDAMVIKSDYALGEIIGGSNIHIMNCQITSTENSALQFGSETVGNFSDVSWANIGIGGAGKAGIGITSQNGSIIDGVTYDNIQMTNCACPIFLKLDEITNGIPLGVGLGSPDPSIGAIRNISINNVAAYQSTLFGKTNTSTIDGYSATNPIENVVFSNVTVSAPGGEPATAIANDPVQNTTDWTPDHMGLRPSYGWYVRYARNISFTNCAAHFDTNDDRPAIIADTVTNILIGGFSADVGWNNTNYDLGFLSKGIYDVENATATTNAPAPGADLRIFDNAPISASIVSPPFFSPGDGIYTETQAVNIASATAGATIRYTIDGSTPSSTNGTIYSGPMSIGSETVLRAMAYTGGMVDSAVNTAIYNFPTTILPPPPDISAFTLNGTTLTIVASNGVPDGSWTLLQSTDAALPFIQWQTNITGSFDGSGNMSNNIPDTVTNSQEFYILKQ